MFVTGIDIATALDILLHIDEVEFDDTCDIAVNLVLGSAHFSSQFQEHTGSQSHLIP